MRCFVAVDLSEPLKETLLRVQAEFGYISMKKVGRQNMHFTLKFLGEIEEEKLEDVFSVMREIPAKFPRFPIQFEGIGVFPSVGGARVLWAGIRGERLLDLCREVDDAFVRLGFPREKSIVPHLTLGRIKELRDRQRLREDIARYAKEVFGTMDVDCIKIKKSVLSASGPTYFDLKEVGL